MTIANKLRDSKAFYAAAGAGDLAAEKLREVPDRVTKLQDDFKGLQQKVDAKDIPGAAVAYVTHVGTRAVELLDELAERGKQVVNRAADQTQAEIEEVKPAAKQAPAKKTSTSTTAKKN